MHTNQRPTCTFILRSQAEYSAIAQAVTLRCILESPSTGQRCGFTDVEALLVVLRAELIELQRQIIPPEQQYLKTPTGLGGAPAVPDPAPSAINDPPTASGSAGAANDPTI